MCPYKPPETSKGTPRRGLELSQLQLFHFKFTQLKAHLGVPLGLPGGFSGHILTLLLKPVLYITLIHLVNISKLVYFGGK